MTFNTAKPKKRNNITLTVDGLENITYNLSHIHISLIKDIQIKNIIK
jgi:hypothetical protein